MHFRRVLVVDDQADERDAIVALLKLETGVTALSSATAAAALDLLGTDLHIDLVISDYVMPGIDGLEFAVEARRLRPEIQVVFITGHDEVIDRVLAGGGIALLKPVSVATLSGVLKETLRLQ